MEKELEKLEYELKTLEELLNGRINEKGERTESFDSRKQSIMNEINELKKQKDVDLLKAYEEADKNLDDISYKPGKFKTEEETQAMIAYSTARSRPSDVENIVNAFNLAQQLPSGSDIKEALIAAIEAVNNRYLEGRTEKEVARLNRAGLSIPDNIKANNKIIKESNLLNAYEEADKNLHDISYKPGRFSTEEETQAMIAYSTARSRPSDVENIVNALNLAQQLPSGSDIKEALIAAIEAVNNRYLEGKSISDLNRLNNAFSKYNINMGINLEEIINKKLEKLKNEYSNIEQSEQKYANLIEQKKNEINELKNKIEKAEEKNEADTKKAEEKNETDTKKAEEKNEADTKNVNNKPENFESKLSKLAEEGPIFVDRDRIKKEDQWLDTRNAENLGKLNKENFEEQKPEETKQEESNLEADIPEIRENLRPQPIKEIKKASVKLISKIRSFDFKEKLDKVVEWIDNHKVAAVAVASGIFIAATSLLCNQLNKADEAIQTTPEINQEMGNTGMPGVVSPTVNPEVTPEVENTVTPDVEEKSDDEIFAEELEQALSGIMNGEVKVFRTAENAANNIEAKTPTQSHLENSWANANPNTFYNTDAQPITYEQAEEIVANGGEVVARYDNNGTHIGYVPVGNTQVNETGNVR